MSDVPPPQASPQVPQPDPDEPITGSHFIPATRADLKEASKAISKETTRIVSTADVKWFLGTVVVIIAGTATTIAWGSGAMDHKVDAGVQPVAAEIAEVKRVNAAELAEVKARVTRVEIGQQQLALDSARAQVMLENLSRDRGLPVPPPAPKAVLPDGGLP